MARVRGMAEWRPTEKSRALLEKVQAILVEYADYLPLTLRQIFYRLVGVHDYEKTEAAYERLGELVNRARRAGFIDFAAIRDDGIVKHTPLHWKSREAFLEGFISRIDLCALDRQAGQPAQLIFAVEAAGMVPLVERIADPYGIEVVSSGGFDSTTAKYDLARYLSGYGKAEVLHIGDHDPSGVHVFFNMEEDVRAFAETMGETEIEFFRLAVTPAQITALSLPTAPPKSTDRRSFTGDTTQVEAIPPDELAAIVQSAITARLDESAYEAVLAEEERIKEELRRTLLPALRA